MRILPLLIGLLLLAGAASAPAEDSFAIAVAPDTQQEVLRANDTRFANRIQWVLSHRAALNIKVFMQVGDLCNWDTPDHIQYQRASAGLQLLDDARLPYVLTIGNHDTAATKEGGSAAPGNTHDNQRNTTTFNSFFPVSRHQIVKGTYEPNKIDNAWHEFSAGGLQWIVIDVELWPRAGAVAWVKAILAAHPDHNGIVITHSYLNGDSTVYGGNGGYGDNSPQYLWDQALKGSPNMRLTFSGHVGTHGYRVDTGTGGNKVYSFLQNYADNENNQLRILQIDTRAGTIVSSMRNPIKGADVVLNDGSSFTVSGVSWVRPAAPVAVAPAITAQPAARTVTAGQTATFTVAASGTPAPAYQWQRNGADIGGATGASYTTPATVAGDSGATFRCVATNSAGSATSSAATLTVLVAPAITTQPTGRAVIVGQTATFTVAATGQPAPAYRWQRDGVDIAGASAASYTTPAAALADSGAVFRCIATNPAGSATSAGATLTVSAGNPVVGTGTGLSGAYFDNQDLTGAVALRQDAAIGFALDQSTVPIAGIAPGTYSVRWAGQVQAQFTQAYAFTTVSDDGVRLWVDGRLLIDQWNDHAATEHSGSIALVAGRRYDIALEFYQAWGDARIALSWSGPSTARQAIPATQLYPAGATSPWASQDLGAGTRAGGAYVTGDTVVVTGAGGDIYRDADGGRLCTQALAGDGIVVARVVSMTNTNQWAKAGVMIREGTAANARHAFCFVTPVPANGVGFIRRTATGAMSTYTGGSKSIAPRWLRLARSGSTITASESADGSAWTVVGSVTVGMANPVQIGFAVTSGDNSRLCTAVFDVVTVTPAGSG